jgi:hypothetical protein
MIYESVYINSLLDLDSDGINHPGTGIIERSSYVEAVNLFQEKSHGALKYCYRMGYNIDNGKPIAIQFELDPNKITAVGNDMKHPDESSIDIHDATILNTVKSNIKRKGHNDFISDDLRVNSIFDDSHRSYQKVRIVPYLGSNFYGLIKRAYDKITNTNPTTFEQLKKLVDNNNEWLDYIVSTKEFLTILKDSPYEEYEIGKFQGKDKYKMTKIQFKQNRWITFDRSPVYRGHLSPFKVDPKNKSTSQTQSPIVRGKYTNYPNAALNRNILIQFRTLDYKYYPKFRNKYPEIFQDIEQRVRKWRDMETTDDENKILLKDITNTISKFKREKIMNENGRNEIDVETLFDEFLYNMEEV